MNSKRWFYSKAIWVGVLMILAAVAEYIAGLPAQATITQAISGVMTIILRIVTTQGLLK